jgi:hypothetical protein
MVTEEVIGVWKNKYRKVYEVTVKDGDDVYRGYFRRPGLETLSAVNKLSKSDEIKAVEVLFDNCWLGGDEILKEDAVLKLSAAGQFQAIMNPAQTEIKNL